MELLDSRRLTGPNILSDLPGAMHISNTIVWKLVVKADHPGLNYRAEFRLPIRA